MTELFQRYYPDLHTMKRTVGPKHKYIIQLKSSNNVTGNA